MLNALLSLKHFRDIPYILENFEDLLNVEDEKFQVQLLYFLLDKTEIPDTRIFRFIVTIKNKSLKSNVMSTLEQIKNRGRIEGREEGREKGREEGIEIGMEKGIKISEIKLHNQKVQSILTMHKNNVPVSQIALFLDTTEDFVNGVITGKITKQKIS